MSSFAKALQSPLQDYVLDEQEVRLEFHENSAHVTCVAEFSFFVRVGAKDPCIRLNASQMRIKRVFVCDKEVHDYEYFDLLGRVVSKPGGGEGAEGGTTNRGSEREVKDLQQYYCHYRARSDGAERGELEIPVGRQLEQLIQTQAGFGLAQKATKSKYRELSLKIEYTLERVQAGIRFVEWDRTGFRRRRAYVHTFEAVSGSGVTLCGGAGARSWFPCIDRPGFTTKLQVHFTVPSSLTVVCSGLCIEQRKRGRRATYLYDIKRTPAHSVGFAVGFLHCVQADAPYTDSFPCYCPIDFKSALEAMVGGRKCAVSTTTLGHGLHSMQNHTPSALGTPSSTNDGTDPAVFKETCGTAQNPLNAEPALDFMATHLELKYPQQTTVRGSSDPSALHTRHFVRKRSRTGSFDDRNDVTVGGGAVAVSITATQSLHSTPVGKVATTTPQKGRSGRRAEHDALVHSQVFVHGLSVNENFHSPALTLTTVRSFAGVVMIPGEYLSTAIMGGGAANRLRLAVANGVAAQWFGCCIDVAKWTDAWVQAGMVGYLSYLYLKQDSLQPPLPDSAALASIWCDLNNAICDEELDLRHKQSVRPLCPAEHEFWFCEPAVVGSSRFVALKAPYIVHVLDTKGPPQEHFKSHWIKRRIDFKDVLAPVILEKPFDKRAAQRAVAVHAGSTTDQSNAYSNTIVSSSTAMDGASTTMGASASAIGGTSHSSSNSGMDDSAHQGSMADSMADSMASASGTFLSGAGGGLTALTGLSGESAGSGVSGGAVALRAAPDELRHKTDVLQAPMLSTTLLTRQLKRGISRMIYQPAAVLHVRGVFSCDEKRANFYFQLANPTHLQPVNHVEIPYLLRSRVSVKEDHKVTRWNPTKVLRHPPFPNGLDGVAKDKGERNSKPFQYLWVDPFFTTVRRPEIQMDSISWANLFYHSETEFPSRLELFQRIGDPAQTAGSPVQTTQCHSMLKGVLHVLGDPHRLAEKAVEAFDAAAATLSNLDSELLKKKKRRKKPTGAAADEELNSNVKRVTKVEAQALKKRRERTTLVASWPFEHVQLLRARCVWALVRVGNVSQSSSMETVPVGHTLRVLMNHFKTHFFDKETQRFVDASRCTDAATFAFKAELVTAIAAVRDAHGRSPVDACLFLRKVLVEDLEWVRGGQSIISEAQRRHGSAIGFGDDASVMHESPAYTAALVEALANTFIYSKLVWLLLRGRPVRPNNLPHALPGLDQFHRGGGKAAKSRKTKGRDSASFDDPAGVVDMDAVAGAVSLCNNVLSVVDDIFTVFNFATTRQHFDARTRTASLADRRVQVACVHALIRFKLYGVERFGGPLKAVPKPGKQYELVYQRRQAFDIENVYFNVGNTYPLQLRVTALRGIIRLKMRPKIHIADPARNFVAWKRNFDWLLKFVIRPLERQLKIGYDESEDYSGDRMGVGSAGLTAASTTMSIGSSDAAYADLLLRIVWEELLAVVCFSNQDGCVAEFLSSGHRISGDIGSDSRHLKPAIDEGFYFLHRHRKFNGTAMRSEITMPSDEQLRKGGSPTPASPRLRIVRGSSFVLGGNKATGRGSTGGSSADMDYVSKLTAVKFVALKLLRDGTRPAEPKQTWATGQRSAVQEFACAVWMRFDHWYARRPTLRLRAHQLFYNVFEVKPPVAFAKATTVVFRAKKRQTLANVYWREMTRGGGDGDAEADQVGVHWADLEPVEPEPPREDPPRDSDPYENKHRLVRVPDRRTTRYRMLPFKRSKSSRGGAGGGSRSKSDAVVKSLKGKQFKLSIGGSLGTHTKKKSRPSK